VLCLNFEYHKYRKDAVIKVFADDCLVDERTLNEAINLKAINLTNSDLYKKRIGPQYQSVVRFVPEKIFLFEISELHLNSHIRIEIENDDNNYTNGFMTSFAYVKFHHIFLFPSCLLEQNKWNKLVTYTDIHKNFATELVDRYGVEIKSRFPQSPPNTEIIFEPDARAEASKRYGFRLFWQKYMMGGSFCVKIPLSRKHHLVHLGKMNPGRIKGNWDILQIMWAFGLINTTT
jgi:hypothetical protein